MAIRTIQRALVQGTKSGMRFDFLVAFSRDAPLPSNAPMSGAEARSAEASAPLAG
jgi:hypothetical protein